MRQGDTFFHASLGIDYNVGWMGTANNSYRDYDFGFWPDDICGDK